MVALSISSTDGCLLRSTRYGHQWIRQSCHYLVNSSGTGNFAHGSPPTDISLVDWRSPSSQESSFFTSLVPRLLRRMEAARASSLPAAAVDATSCHYLPNPQKAVSRAMLLLPGKTGSACLSHSTTGRVYQMCCVAWHRRTSLFGANTRR